jgi:hypothetical protein
MENTYKYTTGEKFRVLPQDAPNIFEFSKYEISEELRANPEFLTEQLNQVSASTPTPKGNIILIENALKFILNNGKSVKESYHYRVLNKWLDFLEYVHYKQNELVVKVFDFQLMFPDQKDILKKFRMNLEENGFEGKDVYLLIYEKLDNKLKLIGGGHGGILLFPTPEILFRSDKSEVVGSDRNGNIARVFNVDSSGLKEFNTRSVGFLDWLQRFVGDSEQEHWWDNLIKRIEKKDSNPAMPAFESLSVLDVIYHYFYVLGKRDEGSKSQFIERSADYLRKFSYASSLYEDTQVFCDRIIKESELSSGLMRIPVPNDRDKFSIEFNTEDFDVLRTLNSDEFFLYPLLNISDISDVSLIKINNQVQSGYFLLKGSKFYIYDEKSAVELSPFFFSYFPRRPQDKLWIMLCNNPDSTNGELTLLNHDGDSIKITEVPDLDYRQYYFEGENINNCFTLKLDRSIGPSITGIFNIKIINKQETNNSAKVAIDLGTSNTYVAYQVTGKHEYPQDIEFSPEICLGIPYRFSIGNLNKFYDSFLNTSGVNSVNQLECENFIELYRSFFPLHLERDSKHKFPAFTALKEIDNSTTIKNHLVKYHFGFHYVNEPEDYSGNTSQYNKKYLTEVKWEKNGELYPSSIKVLMAFTESYLLQKYGVSPSYISWYITQPQSLRQDRFNISPTGKEILYVDEAIAPLNFIGRGDNRIPARAIVVNTDIGGGTVDIGIAYRCTTYDTRYFKTSCYFGFNKLIEKSPVYSDDSVKNIWPIIDKEKKPIYFTELNVENVLASKRYISRSGLPSEFKDPISKNLLLYYCSIIWHITGFLKVLLIQEKNVFIDYSEGLYLQFTGQGSNFIKTLMKRKGVGAPVGGVPFEEFMDSKDLSCFHELFLTEVCKDASDIQKNIKLRLSDKSDSKKITAMGALYNEGKSDDKIKSHILMPGDKLEELDNLNTGMLPDTAIKVVVEDFKKFVSLLRSDKFQLIARNLFDCSFAKVEIDNIEKYGIESINTIQRALELGAGSDKIAQAVGTDIEDTFCKIKSSPLLWPFYGIFQRFQKNEI